MAGLEGLVQQSQLPVEFRSARVVSVSGRMVTVDLGGEVTVPSTVTCNPVPDDWVELRIQGPSVLAIGVLTGRYRQSTITVTATTTTTVTGLLNGVSTAIPKAGTYTPSVGHILPLVWSANGAQVWALERGGVDPVEPPPSGGGGTPPPSGGGTVTTGTAIYAATAHGVWGDSTLGSGADIGQGELGGKRLTGAYFYGGGRFRELQGRTITGFRISIARAGNSGSINFYTHGAGSRPSSPPALSNGPVARDGSGKISLPISMANWLIGGSGTGGIGIAGFPTLTIKGVPYGTLEFDWRR